MKHSPERWRLLLSELDALLERPDADREERLAGLHTTDPLLESQLRDLLRQRADMPKDYLEELPQIDIEAAEDRPSHGAGDCVGPYELLRLLGHGGMGEVWLAQRNDGTLERQVALKLPHAHLLSDHLRKRFRRERNILATLNHPHIAALYDAGVGEDGVPFLAMEWIDGIAITDYCRAGALPLRERLLLFRQVLDAVHYAHARFVAHRDLKPSNILVTGDGVVKLLDFGIAKLLGDDPDVDDPALTQVAGPVATPDYAAPEQLAGQPVTAAVDIYALGLVLLELLTGARHKRAGRRDSLTGADAPRASTQVTEAGAMTVGGLSSRSLRKALRGDLDAILATALDPDAARRYQSAGEFSEDLRRSLANELISVRRLGLTARIGRAARRHPVEVALGCLLVFALLAGSAGIAWQAMLARQSAARATLEAQRAEREVVLERATKEFLLSVFQASDPRIPTDRPSGMVTAKELVDASVSRIPLKFSNNPETQIELLNTAASIYYEFREWPQYRELHRQALQLARSHYGDLHPDVINGLLDDVDEANDDSRLAEAQEGLAQVATLITRAGLGQSAEQARWYLEQGRLLESQAGKAKERITALRAAVDLYAKTAADSRNYAAALNDLGLAYSDADEFDLSAQALSRAIALGEQAGRAADTDLGQQYSNLGLAYWNLGRYDDAETAFARASDIVLRTVGPGDSRYWESAIPYAKVLHERGALRQAHATFEEILRGVPRYPTGVRSTREVTAAVYVRETYAACLAIEGRAAEAVPMLEDAVRSYLQWKSVEYDLRRARLSLSTAYAAVGRLGEARKAMQSARDDFMAHDVPDGFATLRARELWARLLARTGEEVAAEKEFRDVIELDRGRRLAPAALAYGGLAALALSRKDQPAALQWSRLAMAGADGVAGRRDARMRPYLQVIRAKVLLTAGDGRGAALLANEAAADLRRYDDPASPDIAAAQSVLRAAIGANGSP